MTGQPRISFGIIVLNGEPFTDYCLRAIYPFAYEILVVEGATTNAAAIATSDGHSIDGTLEALYRFKEENDPDQKVHLIVKDGFWREKDQQSQAYAKRAKGDYLWQIDIDEFYKPEDMQTIIRLLTDDPSISGISFHLKNFWGGFEYLVDGWKYRSLVKSMNGIRRLFRWGKGYRYLSHRPPIVIDKNGRDLCSLHWIGPDEMAKRDIVCYHYGIVFIKQAIQKTMYYKEMWDSHKDMTIWYRESYLYLSRPFRILHGTRPPSWLERFNGSHPQEIVKLIGDCQEGKIKVEQRRTEDIERLLNSRLYQLVTYMLDILYKVVSPVTDAMWMLRRVLSGKLRRCLQYIRSELL